MAGWLAGWLAGGLVCLFVEKHVSYSHFLGSRFPKRLLLLLVVFGLFFLYGDVQRCLVGGGFRKQTPWFGRAPLMFLEYGNRQPTSGIVIIIIIPTIVIRTGGISIIVVIIAITGIIGVHSRCRRDDPISIYSKAATPVTFDDVHV